MSHTAKTALLWIAGALIFIITMIVFFIVPFSKTVLDYAGVLFVLFAEVMLFGGTMLIVVRVKNNLILQAGIPSALFVYWVITVVTASFYKPVFGNHLSGFVITQIVIVILASAALFGIFYAGSRNHERPSDIENGDILQSCQEAIFILCNNQNYKEYAQLLNDLYEAIKYSDKTVSIPEKESEISNQIEFLADIIPQADKSELQELLNHILLLIKQRNQMALQSRKGSC